MVKQKTTRRKKPKIKATKEVRKMTTRQYTIEIVRSIPAKKEYFKKAKGMVSKHIGSRTIKIAMTHGRISKKRFKKAISKTFKRKYRTLLKTK